MTSARTTLAALVFGLVALPALACGITIELPRLDFPAPTTSGADTSRGCTLPLLPGAPATCAPAAN